MPSTTTTDDDPHAGQGGSYTVNPQTGARELVHRTRDADPTAEQAADTQKTAAPKTGAKG